MGRHLVFHYRADFKVMPRVAPGPNVAALEWFPRSRLPDRSTIAHDGWAADVLDAMDRRGSASGERKGWGPNSPTTTIPPPPTPPAERNPGGTRWPPIPPR